MKYRLKVLRRWLLPPKQNYECICGNPIVERRRKPCVECGSLNRNFQSSTSDLFDMRDRAG